MNWYDGTDLPKNSDLQEAERLLSNLSENPLPGTKPGDLVVRIKWNIVPRYPHLHIFPSNLHEKLSKRTPQAKRVPQAFKIPERVKPENVYDHPNGISFNLNGDSYVLHKKPYGGQ